MKWRKTWKILFPSCVSSQPCRAHPDGGSFFHPQSHRILLSVREHTYDFGSLASSSLDLKWGGSGEVSTRDTLGSRIHPKTSYHWNLPKKKTQPLRLKEIKKDGNAIFSVFQDVSGFQPLFHGVIFRWEMATASQVKVERFQTRFYKKQLVGSNIMKVPCNSNMSLCLNLSSRLKQSLKNESTWNQSEPSQGNYKSISWEPTNHKSVKPNHPPSIFQCFHLEQTFAKLLRPTLQPFVLESDHDPIPENPFQEVFWKRGMFSREGWICWIPKVTWVVKSHKLRRWSFGRVWWDLMKLDFLDWRFQRTSLNYAGEDAHVFLCQEYVLDLGIS